MGRVAINRNHRECFNRVIEAIAYALSLSEYRMKFKLSIGLLLLTAASTALGATTAGLPFIRDNFPKALAVGKQRNLPIFVECWAPW